MSKILWRNSYHDLQAYTGLKVQMEIIRARELNSSMVEVLNAFFGGKKSQEKPPESVAELSSILREFGVSG